MTRHDSDRDEFRQDAESRSLFRQMMFFLRDYKWWWMTPLLLGLTLIALIVWLNRSAGAPLLYRV